MLKIKKISFIGAGNVATNLAIAFFESGIKIESIFSRKKQNAEELAKKVNAVSVDKICELKKTSDLYILAIPDDALDIVINDLNKCFGKKINCVHTSGSVSIDVFRDYFDNFGSLYFLQTFKKNNLIDFSKIPCLINTDSGTFRESLFELAGKITEVADFMDDEHRKILHIAAVFANNFVNHLFSISKNLTIENGVKFDYLFPLIKETVEKIIEGEDPDLMQTGPAVRNDEKVIAEHLSYLKKYPDFRKIYRILTEDIIAKS